MVFRCPITIPLGFSVRTWHNYRTNPKARINFITSPITHMVNWHTFIRMDSLLSSVVAYKRHSFGCLFGENRKLRSKKWWMEIKITKATKQWDKRSVNIENIKWQIIHFYQAFIISWKELNYKRIKYHTYK